MTVLSLTSTNAQNKSNKPILKFRHIEGLKNNQITAFTQDLVGYMWIGTNDGLYKFDGDDYRVFFNRDSSIVSSSSRVKSLLTSQSGQVWMGSTDGLCLYNPQQDRISIYQLTNSFFSELDYPCVIMDMVEDIGKGGLWVASLTDGLLFFDYESKSLDTYFESQEKYTLNSFKISTLIQDEKRNCLWVGHYEDGLNCLNLSNNETKNVLLYNEKGDTVKQITSLNIWNSDYLLVGTANDGLFKLDLLSERLVPKQYSSKNEKYNLINDHIVSTYVDHQNRIWVSNDNGGLHLYDPIFDNFHSYVPDKTLNSLSNISIRCVYQDDQNRLWVGTVLEGVDIIDPMYFKFDHLYKSTHENQSLSNNIIRSFYEGDDGKVWIATDGGGIDVFDPYNYQMDNLSKVDGFELASDAVLSMIDDGHGNVWVSTWNGGIHVIDKSTKKVIRVFEDDERLKSVFNMTFDQEGKLWATSFENGIICIDTLNSNVQSYEYDRDKPFGISSNLTYALFEDAKGNIWFGGEGKGLFQLRKENKSEGKFESLKFNVSAPRYIPSDWVSQIYEDDQGQIICATKSGLIKVDKETMHFEFWLKGRLPDSDVRGILNDENGNYWITTVNGLSRYIIDQDSIINYNYKDGLQKGQLTKSTLFLSSDSTIYIGGTSGVNFFSSTDLPHNYYKPPVSIMGLKLFNKQVNIGDSTGILKQGIIVTDELVFTHDQWRFTLEFKALNYTRPEYNQYAYKLEGLEDNWNYVESLNKATYTHLNPGNYVFKVKASNNDGVWNEEGTSIKIKVLSPWWMEDWFIAIAIGLFVLMVYWFESWRKQRLNLRQRKLKLLVEERTTQLRDKNEELEEVNQKNQDQAEELKTYNENLNSMNEKLEGLVAIRTEKIKFKNDQLTKFAFDNAHKVRGPLTRTMGILDLLDEVPEEDKRYWMNNIKIATQEMDTITRRMSSEIDKNLNDDEIK
ncbi:MAG: hypothetical protein OCD76_24860 [Reichenbachiella sp.]